MKNTVIYWIGISIFCLSLRSFAHDIEVVQADVSIPNTVPASERAVRWLGTVRDEVASHTTEHDHELEFTRLEDGSRFRIVDSPELLKLHCQSEKNYLVEIEAEKTPRFLFWGGNLIVKNFRVVDSLGKGKTPHYRPEDVWPSFQSRGSFRR